MIQQQSPDRPTQRRYGVGVAMLIGWWVVFWMLLAIGFVSFGLGPLNPHHHPLSHLIKCRT